jgi:hypothetical protein
MISVILEDASSNKATQLGIQLNLLVALWS